MRTRILLSFLGVGLAILALIRDDRRLSWLAMAVLVVVMVLRVLGRRRMVRTDEPPTDA